MFETTFTLEQIAEACKNIGHDLRCGECASIFFTGFGGNKHDSHCRTNKVADDPYEFARTATLDEIGARIECAEADAAYWEAKFKGTWPQ